MEVSKIMLELNKWNYSRGKIVFAIYRLLLLAIIKSNIVAKQLKRNLDNLNSLILYYGKTFAQKSNRNTCLLQSNELITLRVNTFLAIEPK